MTRCLALCLLLLLAAACGGGDAEERRPVEEPVPVASTAQPPDTGGAFSLHCAPRRLSVEDTLYIRIPGPRGPYLAVRAPDGILYFLAYPTLGDTTAPPAWLAEEEFASATELRLPLGELRLSPWESAAIRPEQVFAKEGLYEIVVSENLETDMEGVREARCEILVASGRLQRRFRDLHPHFRPLRVG